MPLRCDCCSAPRPAWRYPARTFTTHLSTPTFDQQSVGDWALCDLCAHLLEAGDIAGLTTRSLDALIMDNPELICVLDILKAQMEDLHRQFVRHRTGDPTLIDPGEHAITDTAVVIMYEGAA
jgi:hypothetical protein